MLASQSVGQPDYPMVLSLSVSLFSGLPPLSLSCREMGIRILTTGGKASLHPEGKPDVPSINRWTH